MLKATAVFALVASVPLLGFAEVREGALPPPNLAVQAFRNRVTSADGFAEVYSEESPNDTGPGFRRPILQAASEDIRLVAKATNIKLPANGIGLRIHVGEPSTNQDTRVIVSRGQNVAGRLVTQIKLPSPGFSDLEKFHFAVCRAYLTAYVDRTATNVVRKAEIKDVPDWVVDGILNNLDDEQRVQDQLFVVDLWKQGRMPHFPGMIRDMRMSRGRGRALNTVFVRWMLEKKTVLPAMLEAMGDGSAWNGERLAALLTGESDVARQDHAFDEYMQKLRRGVLSPGRTTLNDVHTFASRLLLYPTFFDIKFSDNSQYCDFKTAIDLSASDDMMVRIAAYRKSYELPVAAMGRGSELCAAAEEYSEFLRALAAGKSRRTLEKMLERADEELAVALEKAQENSKK